jgi:predicted transcriptional regulator
MTRPILGQQADEFACLESIVKNSYGEDNKKTTFSADSVRRKEGEILKLIIWNSRFGISHKDLADGVGLDRKNLRPYIRRLTSKKMITRAPGKQGKYFSTTNVYQNALKTASFFGELAVSQLFKRENYIIPKEKASTYSDYFSLKFADESSLELTLFEFSNKIGAFITYVLIHAMNPRNGHLIRSDEKDLDRDALVQEWTKKAILSIIPFLLREFKDAIFLDLESIRPSDLDPKKVYDVIGDYYLEKPFFQMKSETNIELGQKFEALYPIVKFRLDQILEGLPIAIENYQMAQRIREDHFHMWQKIVNACKHEFRVAKERLVIFDDGSRCWVLNLNKIMHCTKCHKTKFPKSEQ